MNQACYRELRGYKYELIHPYSQETGITGYYISTDFLQLETGGKLDIKQEYAWDGPSGPTIDTLNFMRGSLVHDALYQLIRLKMIPYECKTQADMLLRDICREDGMSKFRSWYVYLAVKYFGGSAAKSGTDKPEKIICASGSTEQTIRPDVFGE